ncbi:L,D-transpeptidase family protein [Prosthecobacter sp.]|uniref:L,D-transpeptidase family protein n=1 Tax=Prosthecobacter sp. TaxID=1965333 RepID=UPI003782F8AE
MNPKNPFALLTRSLLVLAWSLSGVGCSSSEEEVADNPLKSRAWWRGDGVVGKPKIVINLSTQRVHYYKGKELVGVSPISSGRESHGTVTGSYRILDKDIDHRSSLFGAYVDKGGNVVQADVDTRKDPAPPGTTYQGANMRYFMRIVGGIGMHEGYLPGYPASHGCIRLPTKMAVIFFKETPEGTPVEITGESALAATESAIPIGVEKIEDEHEAEKKKQKDKAKDKAKEKAKAPEVAEAKKEARPKTTVRRAIVENSKSSSGLGSWFNWTRRPPRGATIYLQQ